MPSQEEINDQRELLTIHRRNLANYLKRREILGSAHTSPEIDHGISDSRNKIGRAKEILRAWRVPVEDHPNDENDEVVVSPAPKRLSPPSDKTPNRNILIAVIFSIVTFVLLSVAFIPIISPIPPLLRATTGTAPQPTTPSIVYEAASNSTSVALNGQIAFVSSQGGNDEIHLMNVNGLAERNLTMHKNSDVSPTWSPDGTQIAFVSKRDGDKEIYVMKADGSDSDRPKRLTMDAANQRADDMHPTWSPDGKWIAFASNRGDLGRNQRDIYIMQIEKPDDVRRLTEREQGDDEPYWSPK